MPLNAFTVGWVSCPQSRMSQACSLATSISPVLEMAVPEGATEAYGSVMLSKEELGQG